MLLSTEDLAAGRRILQQQRDDLSLDLREDADGRLSGLTVTGKYHIHRLRLNRREFGALRTRRQNMAQLCQMVAELVQQQRRLYERIRRLRTEHRAALENEAILLDTILETLRRVLGDITEEENSSSE